MWLSPPHPHLPQRRGRWASARSTVLLSAGPCPESQDVLRFTADVADSLVPHVSKPSAIRHTTDAAGASGSVLAHRLADLNRYWPRIRQWENLPDVCIHDPQHSFASRALALGKSLSMIGCLLGHRKVRTTARCAHLAQHSVKETVARVAESLRRDLAGRRSDLVGVRTEL